MMGAMEILRYAAFSTDPTGGNPAGVVLDAAGATNEQMLAVAAEVGYSETAFLVRVAAHRFDVRYFSPKAEVSFCGHATIAAAVAIAERDGPGDLEFCTSVGSVPVTVESADGLLQASLTSVIPALDPLPEPLLAELLGALGWATGDLDPEFPPRVAYAGAWHPVLVVRTRERLAALTYDQDRLARLMASEHWTTIQLIWPENRTAFHARDPFPPGGVVEDPVTGAAAAAFGGYLRTLDLIDLPAEITIRQGEDLGRPGTIAVGVPAEHDRGITVSGTAVRLSAPVAPSAAGDRR